MLKYIKIYKYCYYIDNTLIITFTSILLITFVIHYYFLIVIDSLFIIFNIILHDKLFCQSAYIKVIIGGERFNEKIFL